MLYLDEITNEYKLCKERINYTQDGETIEKYVGSEGHDWWIEFEKTWKNMTINKFIPVEPTDEQKKRFEEVLEGKIKGHQAEFAEYVETGKITEPEPTEEPKDMEADPSREPHVTLEDLYKGQLDVMQALTDMYLMGSGAMDMADLPTDGGGN